MVLKSKPMTGQNLMCIVYHHTKLPVYYQRQLKLRLDGIFYYTRIFTNVLNFTNYIRGSFIVNKLVFIISGDQAKCLCDIVKARKQHPQNPFLYELQFNREQLQSKLPNDKKFRSIDVLLEKIVDDVKNYNVDESEYDSETVDDDEMILQQSTLSFGIHDNTKKQQSFCYLSREALKFILFQSFVEILLGIQIDEDDVKNMWISCRRDAPDQNKNIYVRQVDKFEKEYNPTEAIRFYTEDSFLFRSVNKALRCENIEKIFVFRPLITHLHQQLCELGNRQRSTRHAPLHVLRRGKKLPTSILQQLKDNTNKFISMNGFLSTTKSTGVAEMFADTVNSRMGYETVIFEMHLDETQLNHIMITKRPFADISEKSVHQDEDEVLFFIGFIWRIKSVVRTSDNDWKVELELSTDMDLEMINNFSKLKGECTCFTLGKILHELGEYADAINFYQRMLMSSPALPVKTRVDIHYHIAISACTSDLYGLALDHLQKAERLIEEVTIPSNGISDPFRPVYAEDTELSPMCISTNMGLVYQKMNDTINAKRLFDEALGKHGSNGDRAKLYYCIGVLECERGSYNAAHDNYCHALDLAEDQTLKTEIKQRLDTVNEILNS